VGAITGIEDMAKTSPGEFMRQVRAEIGKVVWPTRQETTQTAIMVLIMTIILAIFFLGVDAFFNMVVQGLLDLAK
jgi:preprotein translocase subunit SecE